MSNEEIINMPANGELMTVNHLIGNTWIVWVDCKTDGMKVSNKFVIK